MAVGCERNVMVTDVLLNAWKRLKRSMMMKKKKMMKTKKTVWMNFRSNYCFDKTEEDNCLVVVVSYKTLPVPG